METCNWEDTLSRINKNSGKLSSKYSPAEKRGKKTKHVSCKALVTQSVVLLLAAPPERSVKRIPDLSGPIRTVGWVIFGYESETKIKTEMQSKPNRWIGNPAPLCVPAGVFFGGGAKGDCSSVNTGCDGRLGKCWLRYNYLHPMWWRTICFNLLRRKAVCMSVTMLQVNGWWKWKSKKCTQYK